MKELFNIRQLIRINKGIIISLFVFLICSQQVHSFSTSLEQQPDKVENEGETGKEKVPVDILELKNNDLIGSSGQFHMNHVFHVIMNIEQHEEVDDSESHETSTIPDSFRKVLFSQVISPNAP